MKKIVNVEDIYLAEVRRFDLEMNASEIPSVHGYTFLKKDEDHYGSLFHPAFDYPVYERVPYSNTTRDGEDYGSKIKLVQGDAINGPCYIIQSSLSKIVDRNTISMDEVRRYMLQSNMFFVDRILLLQERDLSFVERVSYCKTLMHDLELQSEFSDYYGMSEKKVLKK